MAAAPDLIPIAPVATTAAAGTLVLKNTPGQLLSVTCTAGAVAGYLMVFDAVAAPADGAGTPIWVSGLIAISGSYTFQSGAGPGLRCNNGISLAFSSTGPFSKTASATAFMAGQVT